MNKFSNFANEAIEQGENTYRKVILSMEVLYHSVSFSRLSSSKVNDLIFRCATLTFGFGKNVYNALNNKTGYKNVYIFILNAV